MNVSTDWKERKRMKLTKISVCNWILRIVRAVFLFTKTQYAFIKRPKTYLGHNVKRWWWREKKHNVHIMNSENCIQNHHRHSLRIPFACVRLRRKRHSSAVYTKHTHPHTHSHSHESIDKGDVLHKMWTHASMRRYNSIFHLILTYNKLQ